MIKEIIAALVLVAIAAAGIVNMSVVDKTADALMAEVSQAEEQLASGDGTAAEATVQSSLERWLEMETYSHIMLRHDDVDNVTEAYYELLTGLQTGESADALFGSLNERLLRLKEIEHPKASAIF